MRSIREILEAKGMSQRELADKVGITEVTLSRYINGNRVPKAPIAMCIARALDVNIEEIFECAPVEFAVEVAPPNAEEMIMKSEANALYVVVGRKPNREPFFWHYDTPETIGFNTCSFLKSYPDMNVVIRKATPSEIIKYRSDMQ
jgi:transcriptional regulator with XRE-family HTH domain